MPSSVCQSPHSPCRSAAAAAAADVASPVNKVHREQTPAVSLNTDSIVQQIRQRNDRVDIRGADVSVFGSRPRGQTRDRRGDIRTSPAGLRALSRRRRNLQRKRGTWHIHLPSVLRPRQPAAADYDNYDSLLIHRQRTVHWLATLPDGL